MALAWGTTDPFEFRLARDLGLTLAEIGRMAQSEFLRWRAFYNWEAVMTDFEQRKAVARARRLH